MKILILSGSPRTNGNSETLAKAIGQGCEQRGAEVEFIRLNPLAITGCQACDGCHRDGNCVLSDDMTTLYDKVDQADRLIVASPIYFYALSAQLKLFIDRCQARWSRRHLLKIRAGQGRKRSGHLVAVAATHGEKLFDGPLLTVKYLFDALDLAEGASFLVRGADQRDTCRHDSAQLAEAQAFGRQLALTES